MVQRVWIQLVLSAQIKEVIGCSADMKRYTSVTVKNIECISAWLFRHLFVVSSLEFSRFMIEK